MNDPFEEYRGKYTKFSGKFHPGFDNLEGGSEGCFFPVTRMVTGVFFYSADSLTVNGNFRRDLYTFV